MLIIAHAANNVDFQEFMIVPAGASSFRLRAEVFYPEQVLDEPRVY